MMLKVANGETRCGENFTGAMAARIGDCRKPDADGRQE